MIRVIILLALIGLAAECGSNLQLVEDKDEEGKVTAQYTIDPKTEQKEGMYKSYDTGGKIIEEAVYKKDQLDGERKVYYEDGSVQSIETFVADEHNGRFLSFYDNGKVELQGDFIDGKMEGEWRSYYRNGQLKEIVPFVNNNENGAFIEYHQNGKLKAEGTYLDGDNENGELKLYDENGQLERIMQCNKGVCKTTWTSEADSE
jgi:antitoxin component YwqK of YwqJK toxin-antitoxin module